jgi:hypothetical protein
MIFQVADELLVYYIFFQLYLCHLTSKKLNITVIKLILFMSFHTCKLVQLLSLPNTINSIS